MTENRPEIIHAAKLNRQQRDAVIENARRRRSAPATGEERPAIIFCERCNDVEVLENGVTCSVCVTVQTLEPRFSPAMVLLSIMIFGFCTYLLIQWLF